MKKFAYASLAIAALALTSCGGNKSTAEDSDSVIEETAVVIEDTMANDSETVAVVEEIATETVRPAKPAAKPATKKEEPQVANKKVTQTPTGVTATAKPNPAQPAASSPRSNNSQTGIDAAASGKTQATGTSKGFGSLER